MIEFIVLRYQVWCSELKRVVPMLASDPRARCGESLQIQQHPLGKFGMYARVSHILLSLLGPVYFGYVHSPYVVLVVWSAACAAIFFWSNRASLRHARQVAHTTYPVPLPYMAFFTVLLYVACSAGFLIVYSALYFFVEWLT
jgi:hypothetical protein